MSINMVKNWFSGIGVVLVIVLILWLIGGNKITCRESFWDKNKHVIEIKHD